MRRMPPVARALLAITVGIGVALTATWGGEVLGAALHPLPASLAGDPTALGPHLRAAPAPVLLVLILGRGLGTFAGALLAAALVAARRALVATVVGLVLMGVTFLSLVSRPHPYWFALAAMSAVILAHVSARAIARRDGH